METDENSIVNTGSDQQRNAIIKIIEQSSDAEKIALANWAEDLLFIKVSELSKIEKGRQAIALTAKTKVIIPALKGLAKDIRLDQIDGAKINFSKPSEAYQYIKNFWKRRSLRMKVFISVTGLVAIFTGGSGAGIAALGTAVGLPLAIVLGSASSVAVMFYEEIMGEVPNLQTSYREIEAKKDKHRPRVQNLIAKLKR